MDGCNLVLFAVDTSYARGGYRNPLTTSTARVGFETPSGPAFVRATAGVGRVWGSPTLPAAVFGVAVGTRGTRWRLLLEAVRFQARVKAEEVRTDFGTAHQRRANEVRPVSNAVRFGLEVPLRR